MSAAMALPLSALLYTAEPSAAQGSDGSAIGVHRAKIFESLRGTTTFGGNDALADLRRLAWECRVPNWDGYGARPVSPDAFAAAERLYRALPLGTPPPSVGVEPDGQITFEWYATPKWMLSVSISPDGLLHYAALFGSASQYGTLPFLGQFPPTIHNLVRQVGRRAGEA